MLSVKDDGCGSGQSPRGARVGDVEEKSILEALEWLHRLGDSVSVERGDNLRGKLIRRSEESDL